MISIKFLDGDEKEMSKFLWPPADSGGVGSDAAKEVNGMISGLLELENGLSDWEINFIESVKNQFTIYKRLTDKQMIKLMMIYDERVLEE